MAICAAHHLRGFDRFLGSYILCLVEVQAHVFTIVRPCSACVWSILFPSPSWTRGADLIAPSIPPHRHPFALTTTYFSSRLPFRPDHLPTVDSIEPEMVRVRRFGSSRVVDGASVHSHMRMCVQDSLRLAYKRIARIEKQGCIEESTRADSSPSCTALGGTRWKPGRRKVCACVREGSVCCSLRHQHHPGCEMSASRCVGKRTRETCIAACKHVPSDERKVLAKARTVADGNVPSQHPMDT